MKYFILAACATMLACGSGFAQSTFEITGTPIPSGLLQQNYGSVPKGVGAYDFSICNITETKQSIVSSRIYQALADSNASLQPIGRQIMLAAILRNQNHSVANILNVALSATTGVLSILGASKYKVSGGVVAGAALGSLAAQQVLNSLKPILSPDQLEKFETQVLEPALVLDGGSCVERTVFVTSAGSKANIQPLSFHIH